MTDTDIEVEISKLRELIRKLTERVDKVERQNEILRKDIKILKDGGNI